MSTNGKVVKKRGISVIWIIPLLALALAGWLIYKDYQSKGLLVSIQFDSASGLTEGKTKVKLKDVDIGIVESIELTDDLEKVWVRARLDQSVREFIDENTQFWVERARVDTTGISGLGTLLSGAYISAYTSSEKGEEKREFIGLESQPLTAEEEGGSKINLIAQELGGLSVGAPIYYRSVKVGAVERVELSLESNLIEVSAYVFSPYDAIINEKTIFWRVSGVEANVSAKGIDFKMNSVQALITGAIEFETNTNAGFQQGEISEEYVLHPSFEASRENRSFQKEFFVLNFDENIRGLNVGAPVEFRGVSIGRVTALNTEIDEEGDITFPISIEIEPERIGLEHNIDQQSDAAKSKYQSMLNRGLRATLGTGNIITGQKLITLDTFPDAEPVSLSYYNATPIIPTKVGGVKEITTSVSNLLDKFNELDVQAWNTQISDLLSEVQTLVADIDNVSKQTSGNVNTAFKNLNDTIGKATLMIESFSEGSATRYDIDETLRSIKQAADAVKSLANTIDKKPNSVIFGKE